MSRNPSELQREHEEQVEQVEQRNKQLKDWQESRNNIAHHEWCQELREVRDKLRNGYLCKSDKERLFKRQRQLEKLTGFMVTDTYNG